MRRLLALITVICMIILLVAADLVVDRASAKQQPQYLNLIRAEQIAEDRTKGIPVLTLSKLPQGLSGLVFLTANMSGYSIQSQVLHGVKWGFGGLTLSSEPEMMGAPYTFVPYERHNLAYVKYLTPGTPVDLVLHVQGYEYNEGKGLTAIFFGFNNGTWFSQVSAPKRAAVEVSDRVLVMFRHRALAPDAYRGVLAIKMEPSGVLVEYDWTPSRSKTMYYAYVSGPSLDAVQLANAIAMSLKAL